MHAINIKEPDPRLTFLNFVCLSCLSFSFSANRRTSEERRDLPTVPELLFVLYVSSYIFLCGDNDDVDDDERTRKQSKMKRFRMPIRKIR